MSERELMTILESLGGMIGNMAGTIIATLLAPVILTYGIRWFIFKKAGEKGWKALIPIYSDYINYKIAWDGRIYKAIVLGHIASFLLGIILSWIHVGFSAFVTIVLNVVLAGAGAICGMILQFKMARAFGRNDYFAVGLYFLGNVFSAILAFGDSQYQGVPRNDGIGVPAFIRNLNDKMKAPAPKAPVQQQPVQQPVQQAAPQQYQQYQPQQYQQYGYQGEQYPQQQNYPVQQPAPQQNYAYPAQQPMDPQTAQRVRRSDRNSGMYGQ